MRLVSNLLFALDLETAVTVFEGAAVRLSIWEKLRQPPAGVTYKITFNLSDQATLNCGHVHIIRLPRAPQELFSLLGTKKIEKKVLARWSRAVSSVYEDANSDEEHHHHVLLYQFLHHIRGVPTIAIKLPKARYEGTLADQLIMDVSDRAESRMMIFSSTEDQQLTSETLTPSIKKRKPGRPSMSSEEIAWRKEIVQKAERLKRKSTSILHGNCL